MKWLTSSFILMLIVLITSCIVLNNRVSEVNHVDYATKSNLKIHLNNGSLVISPDGIEVSNAGDSTFITPALGATMYDLHRNQLQMPARIWLDEVVFVENYSKEISIASLPGTAAAFTGGAALAVLIFGSCPTFYSTQGEFPVLEGEGFSYSIAPRFEEDDLDRIISGDSQDGLFSLSIRNEAWETHYINQFNLISVDHPPGFEAFPTYERSMFFKQKKQVLLMGPTVESLVVRSKSGNNISSLIQERDELSYRSDAALTDAMVIDPSVEDWLELEVQVPDGKKEVVIGFKLRNTLLNSLFFYEMLLDRQNFEAIDWIDSKNSELIYAMNFYRWYTSVFGLKIDVEKNGKYVEHERIGDTGPSAWNYLAFTLPVYGNGKQKIRLRFIPDNWEIDWIGLSMEDQMKTTMQPLELIEVMHRGKQTTAHTAAQLEEVDKEYLVTSPGEEYKLKYAVPSLVQGMERTYFIQSRGFYMEWLRKHWLEPANGEEMREPLKLNQELIRSLYQSWDKKRIDFEHDFFKTMVPINELN
ncbi:MAG: hypothetical protein IPL46_22515 [Saprospiraceae bacterium]|nr:hypothetical protein [Saprospiraceae bacterium]